MSKSVADLQPGQKGIIKGFDISPLSNKLLEMGCVPGTEIYMQHKAPLGSPICIQIKEYVLALRKSEANVIQIEDEVSM